MILYIQKLPEQLGKTLDGWHRRKLRHLLGIVHPNHISSKNVYKQTNQQPLTAICKRSRLLWLGHVVREGPDSASYGALQMALQVQDIKRPRGRPIKRWVDNIKADLQPLNMNVQECLKLAEDKKNW